MLTLTFCLARVCIGDFLNSTRGVLDPSQLLSAHPAARAAAPRMAGGAVAVLIIGLPVFLSASPRTILNLIFVSLVVLAFIRFGLLRGRQLRYFFWLESLPFTTEPLGLVCGTSLFVMFLVTAWRSLLLHFAGWAEGIQGEALEDDTGRW